MNNILFIDTAFAHTQVFIANEKGVLSQLINENTNEQSLTLNTLIQDCLNNSNLTLKDINAIAVDAGPGSYTGLRVGLGVAKGICFSLDIPIMLFNKLELLAYPYQQILLVLKARNGEGFAIVKQYDENIMEAQHIFYDNFDWMSYHNIPILTDDESLSDQDLNIKALESHILEATSWNQQAQERLKAKQFDDIAYSNPFYLKSAYTTTPKNRI
ncbi:MAG TPA: tRNA (adenosine(37)-N6)-threonylcarbamoyltransferase complex dimerization subunit type 1 TsaB [Edaphocola sp.]|nr:tRNA (adenosine(37)-N6)-threonylcarbamoyltransferase complex dimerization subunit type 1 TsaB [Edaphocola sp.]